MTRLRLLAALPLLAAVPRAAAAADAKWRLPDAEWRKRLAPEVYAIMRQGGTEPPGSSPLEGESRRGTYHCAACDLALFASATKFHSGTGWPSFYAPLPHAVATKADYELGYARNEVHCARCDGHLGHVFDDGPRPTGLRYCMDGLALRFAPA